MKIAFIISLLFHLLIAVVVIFIVKDNTEIKKEVFYADLIRPEDGNRDKKTDMTPLHKGQPPSMKSNPKIKAPSKPSVSPKKDSKAANRAPVREKKQQDKGNGGRDIESPPKQQLQGADQPPQPPISSAPQSSGGGPRQGMPERRTFRDRIFDKDVIKEIARAEKPTPDKEGTITFDSKEFKYHGYLKRLRERIEGIWKYPNEAAERGIYGDLYLRFTIKKNGRLGAVELVRTSGHKILDDAAMKALWEADPFWPVPDELGKEAFTITGHFVYSIYGTHIR